MNKQLKTIPKIGFFDSGIGGLSVLQECLRTNINAEYFYLADSAYNPYGDKSDEIIKRRSIELTEQLIEKNVDLIVVACNTATALSINILRDKFSIPFVGIEPYINYINQSNINDSNCVALVTPVTAKSEKFRKLLAKTDPEGSVDIFPCEGLAQLVEQIFIDGLSDELLAKVTAVLRPLKNKNYSHAILGCTHYPFIEKQIANYLGLSTIDPAPAVAERVKSQLHAQFDITNPDCLQIFIKDSRERPDSEAQEGWNVFLQSSFPNP